MPRPILVVSAVLAALSLLTIGLGVSLIPTDMGRAWLNIGFILFTGAAVTLSLGYATKALVEASAKSAQPSVRLPVEVVDAAPAPQVPEATPTEPASAPEAAPHMGLSAGVVAAGAAVLGAGAVALGVQKHAVAAEDSSERFVEDLEKEILLTAPTLESHAAERAQTRTDEAERDVALASAEAAPEGRTAPEDGTFDLRLFPEEKIGAPAQPEREPEPELVPEPVPASAAPAPTVDGPAEEPAEAAHAAAERTIPAGLIADDDLARLAEEDMSLAPLDTLDVVGAYDSAGVRFTMYSDGSVNAVAPHGARRYRSLEALRKQLDAGLPAV